MSITRRARQGLGPPKAWLACAGSALSLLWPAPALSQTPEIPISGRGFDVLHYAVLIEPAITERTITGQVVIRLRMLADGREAIELDRGELTIVTVREGDAHLVFEQPARRLRVRLPARSRLGEVREVAIDYHGAPRSGLVFVPERSQVYTIFSTSQWLPSVGAPDDKATLQLGVVLPSGVTAVGSGQRVTEQPRPNGTVLHEWREERPMPSYTFGFAAGNFTEATVTRDTVALRYLADGFSSAELARTFGDTPDMLRFLQERAGIRYPSATYTQALVANTIGQEANGFAVLSEAYGRALLDDPQLVSLSAHELAHQWWGNWVTCLDWTHFWLNEGFATFMAAAYREQRFGRDAYLGDIDRSRRRYEQVREAGGDRSLVFPDWDRPTANDRTLVYHKGAYVLHLLREMLGDDTFWEGIRHYTITNVGRSVTTDTFQQSMEQSSGRSLAAFFARWVYLTESH